MKRWSQRHATRQEQERCANEVKECLVEAFSLAADPSVPIGVETGWSEELIQRIALNEFNVELPNRDARQMLSLAMTFEKRGRMLPVDTVRACLAAYVRHEQMKGATS